MIRENLTSSSSNAAILLTPSNGVTFQRRLSNGASSLNSAGPGTVPYWLKLTRVGNLFTGSKSIDGINWTVVGSVSITMSANVYVGLAVTSHNNSVLCNTSIDNVAVTQPSGGGSLPAPWQKSDIGSVGAPGNASYSSGTFTVNGSGSDIWNTADSFHYVYQPLNGNGQIVARVVSVQNTNGWAKAGVMIRETLTNTSSNAAILVTPSNGVTFQRRTTTAGNSLNTISSGAAPYWVKLARSGNTFTASKSTDGINWTVVGSTNITMSANVYIGLAVTSHNNGALCTVVFDNVSAP
jgi:regulation of enolase protein 1 (concanavalin A-like superfamily)